MTTQAGWYPDPAGSGRQRYFDGENWTDNYAPAAATGPVPPIKTTGSTGKTLAIVFGALCAVLLLFIALAVVVGSGKEKPTPPTAGSGSGNPSPTSSDRSGRINQSMSDGKFAFTVTGSDEKDSLGLSQPRGRFVIVDVTVKNNSKREESFQVNDQMLIGSNGAKYRADWVAATSINDENTLLLRLGPGFSANYRLPFDLPTDVAPAKVELHDSALSGGATVKLS